jgi:hypothetical protein
MWDAYRKHHGKDSPVLFWKAPTRIMNPSVPQSFIDAAYEDDAASAEAEYGAEFRTDVESFISRDVVDAATIPGRYELPRVEGCNYVAFVDPSGGSGKDSMTMAIAHMEGDRAILDCVREIKPPLSPDRRIKIGCRCSPARIHRPSYRPPFRTYNMHSVRPHFIWVKHRRAWNASAVLKIFVRQPERTFLTVSALLRLAETHDVGRHSGAEQT